MVKRTINWTKQALIDRIQILEYWIKRNRSKEYSIKFDLLLVAASESISRNPELGRKIANLNARAKIIKHYFIIYEFDDSEIDILVIWDTRQDPKKLKHRLKK